MESKKLRRMSVVGNTLFRSSRAGGRNGFARASEGGQAEAHAQDREVRRTEREGGDGGHWGAPSERSWGILREGEAMWMGMAQFREQRERCMKYTFGDQWCDMIETEEGRMRESEYIRQQGNIVLKNNLIRRLVRAVIGVYINKGSQPICKARDREEQVYGETITTLLGYVMDINRMKEVNRRSLEDFLIGGLVVHRKWYGCRNGEEECWTDYVNPRNFFIDSHVRDFRGWDTRIVGEIHDVSLEEVQAMFARCQEDCVKLEEIYRSAQDYRGAQMTWEQFGMGNDTQDLSYWTPRDPGVCRVFEVWRKEVRARLRCHDWNSGELYKIELNEAQYIEAENRERLIRGIEAGIEADEIPLIETEWIMDEVWRYYFLTPTGEILVEGDSPYEHGTHPYVWKAYPFIDGQVHSFVGDIIDQQKYVNRLITMYDWIMRASAKGVLMFPEECIPDGYQLSDITDEWSKFNGVIVIRAKAGVPLPQQISNNATNIGIHELLAMQMKLVEDISGVSGALQGKEGFSGMSASLYAQQTQNSVTSLADIMSTYDEFETAAAAKDVSNIQQYYDNDKVLNIVGREGTLSIEDPEKIRKVKYDLSIGQGPTAPAYRALANEMLLDMVKLGKIELADALEVGDFPFGDKLKQLIESRAVQQQQMQGPLVPA